MPPPTEQENDIKGPFVESSHICKAGYANLCRSGYCDGMAETSPVVELETAINHFLDQPSSFGGKYNNTHTHLSDGTVLLLNVCIHIYLYIVVYCLLI
jgi:hypothetical protein